MSRYSTFDLYEKLGFFAYSGEDGDLFRKQGLGGWRISDYGCSYVRIQTKGERWKGIQYWNTERSYGDTDQDGLTREQYQNLKFDLSYLVKHGRLPDEDERLRQTTIAEAGR